MGIVEGGPDHTGVGSMAQALSEAQLRRIRRAFDSAFQRMCAAGTQGDLEDELSNLLNQLYRLSELCWKRLGYSNRRDFYRFLHSSKDSNLRAAGAAIWARTFDTHDIFVVASAADVYSDFYTELYGVLVWDSLGSLPQQTDECESHLDYRDFLQGRAVLDTTHRAFDAMAALL